MPANCGSRSAAMKSTASRMTTGRRGNCSTSRPPEQAPRPRHQHGRHQGIDYEASELRPNHLAKRIGETDEQRADEGALDAADAADHHHHERDDEHLLADARVYALDGGGDHRSEE